jgi:uncharacterized protein (DUF4415 family)
MTDEEWQAFAAQKDEDIDKSDISPIPAEFWAQAKVVVPEKKPISIRVDEDVLQWFRQQGKGYQSRMNAVLRAYVQAHQPHKPSR